MKRPYRMLTQSFVLTCVLVASPHAEAQRFRSRTSPRNSSAVKDAFLAPIAEAAKSTVRVMVGDKSVALGCVVSKNGEVLTKASLIGEGEVLISIGSGEPVPAVRMATNERSDLALLKATRGEFIPITFDTTHPKVGRLVAAPSEAGRVAGTGMVTIERSPGLRSPANSRNAPPVYMGVVLQGNEGGGVRVTQPVERNVPAYRAGLRRGDVIISIDGFKVNSREDVLKVLRKHTSGDRVALRAERDGESRRSNIVLRSRGIDQWGGGPFSERRFDFGQVITHDITLNRDLCGGPLVTSEGKVVGINIARALRVATYAIPAKDVTQTLAQLREEAASRSTASDSKPGATAASTPSSNKGSSGSTSETLNQRVPRVARTKPIVAAGVPGSLFLMGSKVPTAVLERFMDLAKRDKAKVVVITGDDSDLETVSKLEAVWKEKKGQSFDRLSLNGNDVEQPELLDKATAVWLTSSVPLSAMQNTKLSKKLEELRASGQVPLALPTSMAATMSITSKRTPGLSLLPDSIVTGTGSYSKLVAAALGENPHLVNYTLGDDTSLFVRGRYLFAMGGTVTASFAPSAEWPDRTVTMEGRNLGDLTALRRFATRRNGPVFPPQKPEPPTVENGTLMIVGGGGLPRGLTEQFLKEAGGKDAVICIIPISMPASQLSDRSRLAEYFKELGVKEVHVLKQRTPEESDSPEVLDILKRTTGIWFGGGRQWRFIDGYEGTKAAKLMHDVLKRGGVVGGSSAGASIQGDYMARGNPLGPRDIMADGYETGLRFLKGVAIDQHFTQRNRLPDMSSLMKTYPQLLGIGIDETTAIIVKKNIAEVVGRNRVCFYDRRKAVPDDGPDYEELKAGGKYDLVTRRIIEPSTEDKTQTKSNAP